MASMNVMIPNLKGPEVRQMPHFLVSERMLVMPCCFSPSNHAAFFVEVSAGCLFLLLTKIFHLRDGAENQ